VSLVKEEWFAQIADKTIIFFGRYLAEVPLCPIVSPPVLAIVKHVVQKLTVTFASPGFVGSERFVVIAAVVFVARAMKDQFWNGSSHSVSSAAIGVGTVCGCFGRTAEK
jgi:hypothetical protein